VTEGRRPAAELRPSSLTCRRRGRGWSPRPATPGASGLGAGRGGDTGSGGLRRRDRHL